MSFQNLLIMGDDYNSSIPRDGPPGYDDDTGATVYDGIPLPQYTVSPDVEKEADKYKTKNNESNMAIYKNDRLPGGDQQVLKITHK